MGEHVVVIDHDGYFVGPGIAELLAGRGHRVTVVTPAAGLGHFTDLTMERPQLLLDLRRLGVEVLTSTRVVDTHDGELVLSDLDGARRSLAADTVVLVGQREPSTALYRELLQRRSEWAANGVEAVYRAGDCERPMFIADAIFAGHRLAREIDSPDPSQPLPWVRERRIVGGSDADYVPGTTSIAPVH